MTEYRKTQLTLPREVGTAFAGMTDDQTTRDLYIATLRRLGWTLQSISEVTGVTRERVRQIDAGAPETLPALAADIPTPAPPLKPVATPRVYVEPDPVKLARLMELQPEARSNRSNTEKYREAAEEYSALIWEIHDQDGVPLYRLAKRLGVTHGALRFRLARYGYKLPQNGVSKVYTRIDPAHRVNG